MILPQRTRRSSKRISNRQLAVNCLAVVKVFGIESFASDLECGSDHQGVINIIAVSLRNPERCFMGFHCDRERRGTENSKGAQRFRDLIPGHGHFSPCNRSKLVQDLDANHATRSEKFFRLHVSRITFCQRVEQDLGVKKSPIEHCCLLGRKQTPQAEDGAIFADEPERVVSFDRGQLRKRAYRRSESRSGRPLLVPARPPPPKAGAPPGYCPIWRPALVLLIYMCKCISSVAYSNGIRWRCSGGRPTGSHSGGPFHKSLGAKCRNTGGIRRGGDACGRGPLRFSFCIRSTDR